MPYFDADGSWTVVVPTAPGCGAYGPYFEEAVPHIAATGLGGASSPCVVVARVVARVASGRSAPAGPQGRAKGLLDALHDQRRSGPRYAALGAVPPLPDDDPAHVIGLAVEVTSGPSDRVEYHLGGRLRVHGQPCCEPIDVSVVAPNDIDSSSRLLRPRRAFAEAVAEAVAAASIELPATRMGCLVIRHHPQRDEDNTWATWIGGLTGRARWSQDAWRSRSPFQGWVPRAIASVSDATLPQPVRFEVYAGQS